MKIAYEHLSKYIESKISIEQISDKLLQLGHEHEIIDEIFDIEITPNRGDCLSVEGLLRDLNVFFDVKLNKKKYDEDIDSFDMNFINNAKEDCSKISFLRIEVDGKFKSYDGSLESYFNLLDVNKKNFFTDISNYIAYETGQPTHCYDAKKIKSAIRLEEINFETKFTTLLNKEIKLTNKNLVFLDDNKIINLAGIVGSNDTSCSTQTTSVIVECAYFNPEKIIGKSTRYGIQSDAAYKFERGVDIRSHDYVLRRFLYLVQKHTNILSVGLFSEKYKEIKSNIIKLNIDNINNILGTKIDQKTIGIFLNSLGFKISKDEVEIPSFRGDIHSENDLAEEIARCFGYNNIKPVPLKINPIKSSDQNDKKEKKIKNLLLDFGFNEVINNPFSRHNNIKVDNPIDSNKPFLRKNITESLIENLLFNERRQHDSIKLFEISDVYTSENKAIQKKRNISIIASGRVGKNYNSFAKKIDENYIKDIFIKYVPEKNLIVNEISRNDLDSKIKSKIYNIEIDTSLFNDDIFKYDAISKPLSEFKQYEQISDLPKIIRDLSFSISNKSSTKELINLISDYNNKILKDVFVFDYFNNSDKGIFKLGYRFVFQSHEKTLTDNDVNIIMESLIEQSMKIDGIEIPGLQK